MLMNIKILISLKVSNVARNISKTSGKVLEILNIFLVFHAKGTHGFLRKISADWQAIANIYMYMSEELNYIDFT